LQEFRIAGELESAAPKMMQNAVQSFGQKSTLAPFNVWIPDLS
jgi:hypothetical protein